MSESAQNLACVAGDVASPGSVTRDHGARRELNDEVHARPPARIASPSDVSFLAVLHGTEEMSAAFAHLVALVRLCGAAVPEPGHNHYLITLFRTDERYPAGVRLKWERHSEFTSFTLIGEGRAEDGFDDTPLSRIDAGWVAGIGGERIAAAHMTIRDFVPGGDDGEGHESDAGGTLIESDSDPNAIAARWFKGQPPIGGKIADGGAEAYSDFRIHTDGFSRFVVRLKDMNLRQCGRMVQRLLELETYRMLALLALPAAKSLSPFLDGREQALAAITADMAKEERADQLLLERLATLEAEVQQRDLQSHYRFSAAAAYYEIVLQRAVELRQGRVQGTQTFSEFIDRRLAPAMRTCRTVAARQEALADRTARVTQLLSTRVSVRLEQQNQELLHSMNARARHQLRLQETVEGLSVAAVSYYAVGLIGYAAKGLSGFGLQVEPGYITAAAVPVVVALVALGLARTRKRLAVHAELSDDA